MFETEKQAIVDWGKKLVRFGHVTDGMGNISMRVSDDLVVISPSGIAYDERTVEHIPVIDFEGRLIDGNMKPSVEYKLHLEIYKNFEDVKVIFHTHSVYASVLSVLRKPLPVMTENLLFVAKEIPVCNYADAGTYDLALNVVKAMKTSKAVIMANHGLICAASSFSEAFRMCEIVERNAQIYVLAMATGLPVHIISSSR